jgi:hypothetical protein
MGKVVIIDQGGLLGKMSTAKSTKLRDAVFKKGLTEAQARQALEARRKQVIEASMGYWRGTVGVINNVLQDPKMTNHMTGGVVAKHVSVPVGTRPDGSHHAETTLGSGNAAWAALNWRYAMNKHPFATGYVSTTYWKKTGALAQAFQQSMPSTADFSSFGKYARTSLKRGADTKTLAKMEMRIDYPKIKNSIWVDWLIRASFASGRPIEWLHKPSPGNRANPLEHLLLAEGGFENARPWVARFAAGMGAAFHEDLKALTYQKGK